MKFIPGNIPLSGHQIISISAHQLIGASTYCLFIGLSLLWTVACQSSSNKEATSKAVARVGTKTLYLTELREMVPANVPKPDSINLAHRYVENWIKKELMLNEASSKAKVDEADIERQVQDYRYSLIQYEFEKQYLRNNLDTIVPTAALEKYYQENKTNFVLEQNIVRAFFVKVAKPIAQLVRIKALINTTDAKSKQELASLSQRFASEYHLNDSVWVDFDKLISGSPWMPWTNKASLLQPNGRAEVADNEFVYLLRVVECKTAGQTAPLAFAEDEIRGMILNQRKVSLVNDLEKKVYERAKANKEFEIY